MPSSGGIVPSWGTTSVADLSDAVSVPSSVVKELSTAIVISKRGVSDEWNEE